MTYYASDKVPYDEWFDPDYKYEPHPYDNWPMATDKTPVERLHDDMRKEYENPRPEEEAADLHEKMYEIATARNNPFHVGGSENAQSEIDYINKHSPWKGGGSENWHK